MSATAPNPESDARLARAEAILRDAPIPEGPGADVIARTRQALRAASDRPPHTPFPRRRTVLTLLKVTAAALLAAAGLSYLTFLPRAEATFAEVAQKLHDAHTLSYRISVQVPGQKDPMTGREFYKEPGLLRHETDAPQAGVTIMNMNEGKTLMLDPSSKTAMLQDFKLDEEVKRRHRDQGGNMMEYLRGLAEKEGKPAGKRQVGNIEAQGFRVDMGGQTWTIWIDAERKLPVLVETTAPFQDKVMTSTLSEFQIDPKLDDNLFRLEPPQGYKVSKLEPMTLNTEQAFVNLLRLYAESTDGSFPAKPDDWEMYWKAFSKEKLTGPDDPKMVRRVQSVASSWGFFQFELKGNFGYRPEGVKLGDAGKVLFWHRKKGAEKYRAIFGDLHAEDVTVDRLPEQPKF